MLVLSAFQPVLWPSLGRLIQKNSKSIILGPHSLPATVRVGGSVRWRRADIDKYLEDL
jgi:predicted DNA-binding transcriptional regulator AlpA